MSHSEHPPDGSLCELVQEATGTTPLACYQCGRCAAGCPQNVAGEMDLGPTRVMRLLQLAAAFSGEPERAEEFVGRALGSDTPWLCAGCQACTTRCPQGVDIAGVMDVLRQESLRRGQASRSRRARAVQALHQVFMQGALGRGRIHELTLVGLYKLKTLNFFEDAMLGPAMYLKGKLNLLPPRARDMSRVQQATERLKTRGTRPAGPGGHKEHHA